MLSLLIAATFCLSPGDNVLQTTIENRMVLDHDRGTTGGERRKGDHEHTNPQQPVDALLLGFFRMCPRLTAEGKVRPNR